MALIWGRHPIYEALRAGRRVDHLYVAAGTRPVGLVADLLRLADEERVQQEAVDRRVLDRLSGGANHQGLVAEVEAYSYRTIDDLVAAGASAAHLPLILALDSLEDPQNFGTLIRTADAVGATGIVIPRHRAVGITPAVEKASAGAVEHIPIAQVTNLQRGLTDLKRQGYWVVGLDATGSERYDAFRVDVPLVLVVGAEGHGLGRLVREKCDVSVRLPMQGRIASLNAAVAGSIVLYEILRRRSQD